MFQNQLAVTALFVFVGMIFFSCKNDKFEGLVVLKQMSPTMKQIAEADNGTKRVDSLTLKYSDDREVRQYYYCIDYYGAPLSIRQDSCKPGNPIELEKRYLKYVRFDAVQFDIVILREGFHREYFFLEESSAVKKVVYIQTYGVNQWIGLPRHAVSKRLNSSEVYELETLFMAAIQSLEEPEPYGDRVLLEWNSGKGFEKRFHSLNNGRSKDVFHWLERKFQLSKKEAA